MRLKKGALAPTLTHATKERGVYLSAAMTLAWSVVAVVAVLVLVLVLLLGIVQVLLLGLVLLTIPVAIVVLRHFTCILSSSQTASLG